MNSERKHENEIKKRMEFFFENRTIGLLNKKKASKPLGYEVLLISYGLKYSQGYVPI